MSYIKQSVTFSTLKLNFYFTYRMWFSVYNIKNKFLLFLHTFRTIHGLFIMKGSSLLPGCVLCFCRRICFTFCRNINRCIWFDGISIVFYKSKIEYDCVVTLVRLTNSNIFRYVKTWKTHLLRCQTEGRLHEKSTQR